MNNDRIATTAPDGRYIIARQSRDMDDDPHGSVFYEYYENGQPKGWGVRWEIRDGEVVFSTTGHGGISKDGALAYASALQVACAEAEGVLQKAMQQKEND